MPELPEITAYVEALRRRVVGEALQRIRVAGISLLRTYDPPISTTEGRRVVAVRRLGKRIVLELEGELFLVIHLMIAGRLKWTTPGAPLPKRYGQAAFDFASGTLVLTEAGSKRRASLSLAAGTAALDELDPGGLEVAEASFEEFAEALGRERHTLKRTLSDARLFSGIGGAFADEILHRARLSPLQISTNLAPDEIDRLYEATRAVLDQWVTIRLEDAGDGFPEKVTAFHPKMAVHGKYGEPCPVCGTTVQRIVYGDRETNYCPACQTNGKVLADRALSRILKDDWPRTIEELEG